jgi:hypothetical protein
MQGRQLHIIETPEGQPVGFLAHPGTRWGNGLYLTRYELASGVSWWAVTPSVLRYMQEAGARLEPYYPSPEGGPSFETVTFALGREHPAYTIVQEWLPRVLDPYAWYIRVPDLPGFLELIAPVLERRLAASPLVGYSGALKIDLYRDGVKLTFEDGRVTGVAPWSPGTGDDRGNVRFPDLTFLQVLFGYRSLTDMQRAFADCGGTLEGRLLVNCLFPKQDSAIWPIS